MADGTPSFTCPDCGRTSWNEGDVLNGYCGACSEFTAHWQDPTWLDR
jgi:hypothetical protein